ncbi:adenosine deaminase [Caerostris darwini]|uniref:adenosine deaminase n=1 Tax=Caerostris darwini TaxID=1538125 RepID=A0AAV4VLD5_9ARAC|nr:adenosine deaminase [Caerostris darwini]
MKDANHQFYFSGDAEAIERVAYEFCADSAKQGVLYSEVRYNPHLLSTTHSPIKASTGPLTPREVVRCVNRGFVRGSADFNISMRSILCCLRSHPEWSNDVLELCLEFQNDGVVGIDVAGDEATGLAAPEIVAAFQGAAKAGIHRTAHAGEAGPAENVLTAMTDMLVERVGHGYHAVEDDAIYEECLQRGLHFETCPYSSVLTGSVSLTARKHPIVRFAEDNANFSVSRDDPTITQRTLDEEYQFLRGFGLKDVHLTRANFNAARSSFLPSDGKQYLIQKLNEVYGTCDTTTSASNIYTSQNNGGMIQQFLGHFWTTK